MTFSPCLSNFPLYGNERDGKSFQKLRCALGYDWHTRAAIEVAFYLDEDRVCAYTDFSKQRWRDWRTPTHVGSR